MTTHEQFLVGAAFAGLIIISNILLYLKYAHAVGTL
jgi:hypothetical protein